MSYNKFSYFFFIFLLITVNLAALTQVGTMKVKVTVESGEAVEAAQVVILSPELMGRRVGYTNRFGIVYFRNLAIGTYEARVSADGYKSLVKEAIRISLDSMKEVSITLELGEVREVVVVTAEPEMIDTKSSEISSEYDFENYFNHMPTERHYSDLLDFTGGAEPGNNPSVFGAERSDNAYLVDGINTTDSRTQTWGSQFNIDIVQDVEINTAGIKAEYGFMNGSVMNIVTKSGSNQVHGLARLEMYRTDWNDISVGDPNTEDDDAQLGSDEDQWNFSGGGPLIKDHFWWYAGYTSREALTEWQRRYNPFNPYARQTSYTGYIGHFLSLKATAQLDESLKATFFYKEDPIENGNILSWVFNRLGMVIMPEADASQQQGGDSWIGTLTWVPSDSIFFEFRIIDANQYVDYGAQEANDDGYWEASSATGPALFSVDGWFWGAVFQDSQTDRNNNIYAGSMSWLLGEGEKYHDIKAGVEFTDQWSVVRELEYPTGEFVVTSPVTMAGFDNVRWMTATRIVGERLPAAENHIEYLTFYLQDSFALTDNITINAGLRTDIASGENNQGSVIYDTALLSGLAPRLGIAWNLGDLHIRASYNRYFDLFSLYTLDWFNVFNNPETWQQLIPANFVDGKYGWRVVQEWKVGSADSNHSVSSDLTPQYADEFTVGADFSPWENVLFSVNGVWRIYSDLVIAQDMDDDNYYNIENLKTDAYGAKWKEYIGLMVSFRKRPTEDNLLITGSFTLGKTEGLDHGSVETGGYGGYSGQTYANADEWWRELDFPTMQLKLQTAWFVLRGVYIGFTGYLHNGYLFSSYEIEGEKANWGTLYTYPNGFGDLGRSDAQFTMNLQIGFEKEVNIPFDISLFDDSFLIGIYANIYNLFDNQSATTISENIASPLYGMSTEWLDARSYRFGVRLEF